MNTPNKAENLKAKLRYHVTGAIERGEQTPILEQTGARNAERVNTIADIPEHFQLVQDSQDIHATLESTGLLNYESETGCLFVEVLDGDYGAIYMSTRFVPLLTAKVYKLQ